MFKGGCCSHVMVCILSETSYLPFVSLHTLLSGGKTNNLHWWCWCCVRYPWVDDIRPWKSSLIFRSLNLNNQIPKHCKMGWNTVKHFTTQSYHNRKHFIVIWLCTLIYPIGQHMLYDAALHMNEVWLQSMSNAHRFQGCHVLTREQQSYFKTN